MGEWEEHTWPGDPSGQTRAQRTPCRYRAYVPEALADLDVTLPASLAADLIDVEQSVRSLNTDVESPLAEVEAMARFLLRAEAVASSNIEGLRINVRRLARSEAAARSGVEINDETARAVMGNIQALDEALAIAAAKEEVTLDDLRSIHEALLRDTREARWAGVIRDSQNWIGGSSPCRAAFVPPPPQHVQRLLEDLVTYVNSDAHPALMQAAVAHVQFETIHPFGDGNGRTGRALIQLVLRRRGLAPRVVPPVSLVLATDAERYVAGLTSVRGDGGDACRWLDWIDQFVEATGRACADARQFVQSVKDLELEWRGRLGPVRAGSAASALLSELPRLPVFTINTASDALQRSWDAVNQAVTRLEQAGVVRQVTIGRRNRAYEVVGLFEAMTAYERILASPAADTNMVAPVRPVPARASRPSSTPSA
jgi:Fic family protein